MAFRSMLAVGVLLAAANVSFAGAQGKIFNCTLDDNTKAVVDFTEVVTFKATYEGSTGVGTYQETQPNGFFSVLGATGIEQGQPPRYFGIFNAYVIDPTVFGPVVRGILARGGLSKAVIVGAGVGNDFDPYLFTGEAK